MNNIRKPIESYTVNDIMCHAQFDDFCRKPAVRQLEQDYNEIITEIINHCIAYESNFENVSISLLIEKWRNIIQSQTGQTYEQLKKGE